MPAGSEKIDLYKLNKAEYVTPKKPVLLKLKPATYLAIEGQGAPGGERFQEAIGALYAVAFTLKMAKKAAGKDYAVAKLEGLWWGPAGTCDFSAIAPETWNWKLLIRTPEFIKAADVGKTVSSLLAKGKPAAASEVKLEKIDEGQCVQMLHVGPYSSEPVTIAEMRQFVESQGLTFHGLHHEIYLSDPRKVAPEKIRTILRIPAR